MIDFVELNFVEVDALRDKALSGDKDAINALADIVFFNERMQDVLRKEKAALFAKLKRVMWE